MYLWLIDHDHRPFIDFRDVLQCNQSPPNRLFKMHFGSGFIKIIRFFNEKRKAKKNIQIFFLELVLARTRIKNTFILLYHQYFCFFFSKFKANSVKWMSATKSLFQSHVNFISFDYLSLSLNLLLMQNVIINKQIKLLFLDFFLNLKKDAQTSF